MSACADIRNGTYPFYQVSLLGDTMNIKTILQNFVQKRGYEFRDINYIPQAYERKIYECYLSNPESVHTILDVGANIGQTAIAFQKSFSEATIYSFEPFAKTYQHLVANTASVPTIHCFNMALGDSNITMTVASEPEDKSFVNSLLDVKQQELKKRDLIQTENITVRTGQSFCAENHIEKIDILKVDTEGYEIPVLEGFGDFLISGVQSILCEFCLTENKSHQTPLMTIYELLKPKGYEFVSVYDVRHEADGAFHYGNALFVHQDHLQTIRRW
jgi:FkbM family methyltransferase